MCSQIESRSLEFRFHAQIIHDESVNVGLLFQYFCHRFTCTVSGFAVDADQGRIGPVIVGLQGSGKLE